MTDKAETGKQKQLENLLEGRKATLATAKAELNKVSMQLKRASEEWARLQIDGAPGAGTAKAKVEQARNRHQELLDEVAALEIVYQDTLKDPKIIELAEAAIEEAKNEIEALVAKQDKQIALMEKKRSEISEIGFAVIDLSNTIKDIQQETRALHKSIFGNSKILTFNGRGEKLYSRMPFYSEIYQAWVKKSREGKGRLTMAERGIVPFGMPNII